MSRKSRKKVKSPPPKPTPPLIPVATSGDDLIPWLESKWDQYRKHRGWGVVILLLAFVAWLNGQISNCGGTKQVIEQVLAHPQEPAVLPKLRVSPAFRVVDGIEHAESRFPIAVTNVSAQDVVDQVLVVEVRPPVSPDEFWIDRTKFTERMVARTESGRSSIEVVPGVTPISTDTATFFFAQLTALAPNESDTFEAISSQRPGKILQLKATTLPRTSAPRLPDLHVVRSRDERPASKPGDLWILIRDEDGGAASDR